MSNPTTTEPTPQEAAAPTTSEPTMPTAPATTSADAVSRDIAMTDAVEPSSSPAPIPQAAPSAPSPAPGRTGTPSRNLNGEASSRAGSAHPDVHPTNLPNQAVEHGDPARMYINSHVSAVLLEGMKIIGKNKPKNPLKVLGEFLLEESRKRGEPSG
ncbi:dpy-30 domain-containing protein [Colletotrichum incanum]|uniref:Dpy-30 domain-containing protein n=1 Tax=Colletotrichum incanum TaxID=1573173 RepID=A0A167EH65_COLIC|nr:dpy-30 domain-containing protein [Colletotrichum incanum]